MNKSAITRSVESIDAECCAHAANLLINLGPNTCGLDPELHLWLCSYWGWELTIPHAYTLLGGYAEELLAIAARDEANPQKTTCPK